MNRIFILTFFIASFLLTNGIGYSQSHTAEQKKTAPHSEKYDSNNLKGVWSTENKDVKVLVYESNGFFFGKMIEFTCACPVKKSMSDHKDVLNPNEKLRERPWLNMVIVYGLKHEGDNKWSGGYVYNPNTGKTYTATVTCFGDKLEVRGYWLLELIGKSMYFYREK